MWWRRRKKPRKPLSPGEFHEGVFGAVDKTRDALKAQRAARQAKRDAERAEKK